ncbi:MAG TPA: Asp-tRNA(Asn)/Glu-tRNA(Gln) amidotransferase subunit GatC [Planctomycetaceae bacterium]|nr:Asp-tRNA(Asn)/Glu-tRNA(Gln) amidotransferase subunit GatC [Planctomycetaceae bacterium]
MLSDDEVRKVADLARIALSDDEIATLGPQLSKLLEYVEVLNEVETEAIEPMAHAVEQTNVFREDVATPPLPREQALANAPKTDGKYFLVPAVFE